MKVDILTYQRETWFSRKIWVAMCQTKLPVDVANVYAETERDAFEQMKEKIQIITSWLQVHNAAIRTLEINTWDNGNSMSTHWTGPALVGKWKRDQNSGASGI